MSENVLLMGYIHRRHFSKYKVVGLQHNPLSPPKKNFTDDSQTYLISRRAFPVLDSQPR